MAFGNVSFLLEVVGRAISGTPGNVGANSRPQRIKHVFRNGTGDGDASKLFYKRYTTAALGVQTIDLTGTLTDFEGSVVTFAKVVGILVVNNGLTVLTFGPKAASLFGVGAGKLFSDASDLMPIAPKSVVPGIFLKVHPAGIAPGGASTTDSLEITNTDAALAADFELVIWGR